MNYVILTLRYEGEESLPLLTPLTESASYRVLA